MSVKNKFVSYITISFIALFLQLIGTIKYVNSNFSSCGFYIYISYLLLSSAIVFEFSEFIYDYVKEEIEYALNEENGGYLEEIRKVVEKVCSYTLLPPVAISFFINLIIAITLVLKGNFLKAILIVLLWLFFKDAFSYIVEKVLKKYDVY